MIQPEGPRQPCCGAPLSGHWEDCPAWEPVKGCPGVYRTTLNTLEKIIQEGA